MSRITQFEIDIRLVGWHQSDDGISQSEDAAVVVYSLAHLLSLLIGARTLHKPHMRLGTHHIYTYGRP